MSTARDLIPTSLPLSPQDIHPGELAVILAEAAERHKEAAEALAAAQDHFDAAERLREYALSEEQKRQQREEQARVSKLRDMFPAVLDDVERFKRSFYTACDEEAIDFPRLMDLFAAWARHRALAGRMHLTILRYDSEQSRETFDAWLSRIAGWNELIRSVTSWRNGGALNVAEDDAEGFARSTHASTLSPRTRLALSTATPPTSRRRSSKTSVSGTPTPLAPT